MNTSVRGIGCRSCLATQLPSFETCGQGWRKGRGSGAAGGCRQLPSPRPSGRPCRSSAQLANAVFASAEIYWSFCWTVWSSHIVLFLSLGHHTESCSSMKAYLLIGKKINKYSSISSSYFPQHIYTDHTCSWESSLNYGQKKVKIKNPVAMIWIFPALRPSWEISTEVMS